MESRPLHHPAYRGLCKTLKQWRLDANMSQAELAKSMGWPAHSFVQKTEAGERRIDAVEMVRWCLACKADPHEAVSALVKSLRR